MLAPKRSNFGACCQCVIQIELLQHVIYSKHVNWLKVWNFHSTQIIFSSKTFHKFKLQILWQTPEEVRQAISELSRELSTNEIALFSIVLSAEFGQKNLHSTENKSRKNINIKIFLQNFKCCSTTAKDLVYLQKSLR